MEIKVFHGNPAGGDFRTVGEIKWYAKELLDDLRPLIDKLEKATARRILAGAKRRCPVWDGEERLQVPGRKSWTARKRGALKESIRMEKSKFKNGGYAIIAGNYDVFYASFVELGTKSWWSSAYQRTVKGKKQKVSEHMRRPLPEDPFLRGPLEREKRLFWKRIEQLFSGGILT